MAKTKTLNTVKLTPTIGAEVLDVDLDCLLSDEELPQAVMEALEANGVLRFRALHIDDEAQAAFGGKLGELRLWPDNPVPEISEIALLSAKVVAAEGGETEFASMYAAYDDLSQDKKERYANVRVVHSFVASQRSTHPNPTLEQLNV